MKTVTTVTTENMGSCQCGNCYCEVSANGAIRYVGKMDWQKSEWIENPVFPQARRPYGSQLGEEAYNVALGQLSQQHAIAYCPKCKSDNVYCEKQTVSCGVDIIAYDSFECVACGEIWLGTSNLK